MIINYAQTVESIRNRLDDLNIDYEEQVNKENFGFLYIFITKHGKGFCFQPKKRIKYYVLDNGKINGMKQEGFNDDMIYNSETWISTNFYHFCDYLCGIKVDFSKDRRVAL